MKLQEYMDRRGLSDDAAAEGLGRDRTTIYRLRVGQREPSAKLMGEIAVWSDGAVMPNDWIDLRPICPVTGNPQCAEPYCQGDDDRCYLRDEAGSLDHPSETPASEPVPS